MENLETDVMRFMAILGFCLVAVFALVQSLPAADPEPPEIADIDPATKKDAPSASLPKPAKKGSWPESVVAEIPERDLPGKEPAAPAKAVQPPVLHLAPLLPVTSPDQAPPASKPVPQKPVENPKPKPSDSRQAKPPKPSVTEKKPAPVKQTGFTLRFASDSVLESLVERRSVALYAVAEGKVRQLEARAGTWRFNEVPAPKAFYAMDRDTVPNGIMQAFARIAPSVKKADVDWGVILPTDTSAQLRKMLSEYHGGELVIQNDGTISLSQGSG